MTCVSCSSAIERGLTLAFKDKGLVNDKSVNVILLVHKMKITFFKDQARVANVTPEQIIEEVEDLGFGAKLINTFENI